MPTNRPRINITIDHQIDQWLRDTADAKGVSINAIAIELIIFGLSAQYPELRPRLETSARNMQTNRSHKRESAF